MVFCNLIGSALEEVQSRQVGRGKGVPVKFDVGEASKEFGGQAYNVSVFFNGSEIVVSDKQAESSNAFESSAPLDAYVFPEEHYGRRSVQNPLLWGDACDTEDDPTILVACKAIHLVNNISSYIKILHINEDIILGMLVSGAVGYEGSNGNVIHLARCIEDGLSLSGRANRRLSPKELDSMLMLEDKEGYRYNMDMVVSLCGYLHGETLGIRPVKEDCVIIDPNATVRAQELHRKNEEERKAKAAKLEQERLEREKRSKAYAEKLEKERAERIKAEEAAKAAKKKQSAEKAAASRAKKAAEKNEASEIKTPEGVSRNAGAEFFLAALRKG